MEHVVETQQQTPSALESADEPEALQAFAELYGYTITEAAEKFQDAYHGQWDSPEQYAEQFAEDIGAIDDNATWPNYYIDWERAARDLFMDGYTFVDGYVFSDNH